MNEAISIQCPYCGESLVIEPEPSDERVEYVEDCHVCCQPIVVTVYYSDEGSQVEVKRENE
ncbi:MAG: CPXCG motif-containing cysteine-rich protein [Deltaproteobacteria bacterium]|nr:CPXCG motif-containing cysteine-rich protein [Deltaproteobacteria bacterium]